MSIAIATGGMFIPQCGSSSESSGIGGGGGGGILFGSNYRKPIVTVTKVRHKKKKKDINISVENIRNGDI